VIPCKCDITETPKLPHSLSVRCVFVLPLTTEQKINKGLGLKAFKLPSKFKVTMQMETDELMKEWHKFYEVIKNGGDSFFMKMNRYGYFKQVLVRMTKMNPQFKRDMDGWHGVLDLEEVQPPKGYSYDDDGNWTYTAAGGEPPQSLDCGGIYGTFFIDTEEEDNEVTCTHSNRFDGANMEDCINPPASPRDVFGDGMCYALYRFNNNDLEADGNYNATSSDNTYNIGYIDHSAKFNGSNAGFIVNSIPLSFTNDTISFWLAVDSSASGRVFEAEEAGTVKMYIEFDALSNKLIISGPDFTVDAISASDSINDYDPGHGKTVTEWQHICVVFRPIPASPSEVHIYIDGSESLGQVGSIPAGITAHDMFLGRNGFGGRIDQLRLLNDDLGDSRIEYLYKEVS